MAPSGKISKRKAPAPAVEDDLLSLIVDAQLGLASPPKLASVSKKSKASATEEDGESTPATASQTSMTPCLLSRGKGKGVLSPKLLACDE